MSAPKTVKVEFTFANGEVRRLTGDDANRWMQELDDLLEWIKPARFHSGGFPWRGENADGTPYAGKGPIP